VRRGENGIRRMLALTPARVGLVFHRDFVRSPRRGGYIRSRLPLFAPGFITRDRRTFAMPWRARVGDIDFRALIGEGVIELAPEQHTEIVRRELEREFRFAGGFAAAIGLRRINFFPVQYVQAPFVTRSDFVWLRSIRRTVVVCFFAVRIANF